MDELRPDINPYSTPTAPLAHAPVVQLIEGASRWKRLGAWALDVAILFACGVPMVISGDKATGRDPSDLATFATLLLLLVLLVVDMVLLARRGQTLGKCALGIRIVGSDGRLAGLWRSFGVRYLLNGLIGIVPFYSLVDILFIFSDDRRCLHDRMADTVVVDV